MSKSFLVAIFIATVLSFGALTSLGTASTAMTAIDGLTYSDNGFVIVIQTDNMEIAINKTIPAVVVRELNSTNETGYGMIVSSVLGYNETEDGLLVLEDVPYHASFEHATWTADDPVQETDDRGSVITVAMHSSVPMNKRIAYDSGNPEPGSPGIEIIDDWAYVTIEFTITSGNYSSNYDVEDAPDYLVNGSSELKFDVNLEFNTPIDPDHLALDIGVMKMDFETFVPTSMDEPYLFQGYQSDEISISDPLVNETDGTTLIMHPFQNRGEFKQIFTFVDENGTLEETNSFFCWASEALQVWEDGDESLENVTAFYRTDGTALKVYLSTPIDNETASILHDPSLGLFEAPGGGGGVVILPDGSIIGTSAMSSVVGILIGFVAASGVGIYAAVRKKSSDEDPADIVSLEKNRYYRK
ncbi:MAG: hypothetical protein IH630_02525 [Thermoplasmata archaeon]|nr:hypothetical protein [Thermoplasmata archaeon]